MGCVFKIDRVFCGFGTWRKEEGRLKGLEGFRYVYIMGGGGC